MEVKRTQTVQKLTADHWPVSVKKCQYTLTRNFAYCRPILGLIATMVRCGLLQQTGSVVCLCVCLSDGHVREPCKTAEPIEMPFGGWTWVSLDGVQIPQRKGQFLRFSGPLKSTVVTAATYAAKKISNSIGATGAADCIAADWPVSY